MISISVCMIVKNEEDVLARCLTCASQFSDELIIVDTGSSDRTKEIAHQFTNNVYDFEWCDDFSKARNYSFSKATKDYCMWLDADDVVLDEDIAKINELKKVLSPDVNVVLMKYNTAFDANGKPTFSYYRERLLRRIDNFQWAGVIHEVIAISGYSEYKDIAITHRKEKVADPDRNIRIFEQLIENGNMLNPREQFYYARELYYHKRFQEAIDQFTAFLDGKQGWIENNIDACEMIGYCWYALQEDEFALMSLFKSFQYDRPRAELCCDIGKHYFDRFQYEQAIFWYETAMSRPRNDASGAFVRADCYGYIPAIQLCVCWYKLGDNVKANKYNEIAGEYDPESVDVKNNRKYFN